MLNMIRADLYRVTRPRLLRGLLWQYALVIVFIAISGGLTSLFALLEGYLSPERIRMDGTLSAFYAGWLITSPSIAGLCCSFGALELLFTDLSNGYIKNLVSSFRGRLALFAEKLLFVGIWSLLCLAVGFVAFGILLVVFIEVGGFPLPFIDNPFALAMWFAGSWIAMWALATIPLFFALATKRKLPSYIFAALLILSSLSIGLMIMAQMSHEGFGFLEPVGPLLFALGSSMPDMALQSLSDGARSLLGPASAGALDFLPNQGLQIIAVSLVWLLGASALFLAVARSKNL